MVDGGNLELKIRPLYRNGRKKKERSEKDASSSVSRRGKKRSS